MKHLSIALVYLAFFGAIVFAIWITNSAAPLWALLLAPSVNTNKDNDE